MSPKEAFKFGFLAHCAEKGLDGAQTDALVKRAFGTGIGNVLGEMVEAPGRIISALGPSVINAGLIAGVGLPIAAGAGTGWALAKATDDDSDIAEAKTDETLAELQRLTDQARRATAMKQLRGTPTIGVSRMPPGAST